MRNDPYGHRVKVRLGEPEELKKGLIFIPEDTEKRQREAVEIGVLVAKGNSAFKYIEGMVNEDIPLGTTVIFPAYAGRKYKGEDGAMYRIFEDQDIYGVQVNAEEPIIGIEEKTKCQKKLKVV